MKWDIIVDWATNLFDPTPVAQFASNSSWRPNTPRISWFSRTNIAPFWPNPLFSSRVYQCGFPVESAAPWVHFFLEWTDAWRVEVPRSFVCHAPGWLRSVLWGRSPLFRIPISVSAISCRANLNRMENTIKFFEVLDLVFENSSLAFPFFLKLLNFLLMFEDKLVDSLLKFNYSWFKALVFSFEKFSFLLSLHEIASQKFVILQLLFFTSFGLALEILKILCQISILILELLLSLLVAFSQSLKFIHQLVIEKLNFVIFLNSSIFLWLVLPMQIRVRFLQLSHSLLKIDIFSLNVVIFLLEKSGFLVSLVQPLAFHLKSAYSFCIESHLLSFSFS